MPFSDYRFRPATSLIFHRAKFATRWTLRQGFINRELVKIINKSLRLQESFMTVLISWRFLCNFYSFLSDSFKVLHHADTQV